MHCISDHVDVDLMMNAVIRSNFAFRDISTRYSAHSMHSYVTVMDSALVAKMIKYAEPACLRDQFCKGGSACVEGVGVPMTILDINLPYNAISSAKTMWAGKMNVQQCTEETLNGISRIQLTDTDAE